MKLVLATLAAISIAAAPAAAQRANVTGSQPRAAAPSALVISVANLSAKADADRGAPRKDTTAHAGDVLHYTLTFRNVVERPIKGVKVENPIPAGLRFVEASAKASRTDARAEFSADGGKTFSAQPLETVMVDGKQVQRPVPASRYTHVRWMIDGFVQPKATVVAEYDARLPQVNEPR